MKSLALFADNFAGVMEKQKDPIQHSKAVKDVALVGIIFLFLTIIYIRYQKNDGRHAESNAVKATKSLTK